MSFVIPPTSSLYRRNLRAREASEPGFAALPRSSRFICISSPLSIWSNKGEMQI